MGEKMKPNSMDSAAWELTPDHRQMLNQTAWFAIDFALNGHEPMSVNAEDHPQPLQQPRGAFITLKQDGLLRGCVGTVEPTRPLVSNVAQYAYAAAFFDPRFQPLTRPEFDQTRIEISVINPLEPLAFRNEPDLVGQLRSGIDGVWLTAGRRRATLLPSVWEMVADQWDFWRLLKTKAGLQAGDWSSDFQVYRYTVLSIA
jgi:AmmeMemoRadiSam system protein A